MEEKYRYVNMQGMYICIERNIFSLTWLLLYRTKPFNLDFPAHSRLIRRFPKNWIKAIRVFNIIRKVFLLKFINEDKNLEKQEIKYSMHKGHILLKTSNGYKVFDLNKKVVMTQYHSEIKKSSFKEIVDTTRNIGKYALTPKLGAVDESNLCIYEEYINLYKADRFYPITSYFHQSILPIWQRNVQLFPGKEIELSAYLKSHQKNIFKRLDLLDDRYYDRENVLRIRNYTDDLINQLIKKYGSSTVYLCFSHGDLHAWNILIGKKESVIIDWDTAKERSFLHDFYYMFFHNIFGKKKSDYHDFVEELNSSIKKIKLEKMLDLSIDYHEGLYRHLFYLEYILLDLEKRMDTYTEEKRKINFLEKINSYIIVFKEIDSAYNHKKPTNELALSNIMNEKAE